MNFLVNERYLELAIFLKENPHYIKMLLEKIHLTPISQFVENCLKMEKSIIEEFPNTKWSKDFYKMIYSHSILLLEQEKIERFSYLSSFLAQTFRYFIFFFIFSFI
jgi:hypothetical protein